MSYKYNRRHVPPLNLCMISLLIIFCPRIVKLHVLCLSKLNNLYYVIDGLLFRLFLHEMNDAKMTLQLVIPDTMIDKVITDIIILIMEHTQGG